MQGGQAQVAGLGEIERILHSFPIPDLADQDDVRRLPQGVFQRYLVGFGIHTDFALVHQALFVAMEKLNGIFDGDDVFPAAAVAVIHHRRQGCGLAATGAAHENHQPALVHGDILEDRGQVKFLNRRNLLLNQPQHHPGAAALGEGADPKAGQIGKVQGKIDFVMLVVIARLPVVHNRTHQQRRLLGHQLLAAYPLNILVDLERRWAAGGDENVRSLQFQQFDRQFIEILGRFVVIVHDRFRDVFHAFAPYFVNSRSPTSDSDARSGHRFQPDSQFRCLPAFLRVLPTILYCAHRADAWRLRA